ncbi:MAG TPA: hypothetical protein VGH44_06180 [Candidatus Saccharimonadia bacterium]|jgi:hypothetical protein
MTGNTRPKSDKQRDEPFYESLPATFDSFAGTFEEEEDRERDTELLTGDQPHTPDRADQKFTAIITILLVAVVAIALGLLFLRGLDTIKSALPTGSAKADSSGSLEM